jgi:4-hydroxythreonine-4-phosphate dehydrogenase
MKPKLAITMGDINGIGPEILAKALASEDLMVAFQPIVIGSVAAYNEARAFAPSAPDARLIASLGEVAGDANTVPFIDGGFTAPEVQPGRLDAEAGRCAVEWVKLAVQLATAGDVDAIVTCPLNKEGIHKAGYTYAGHTELIAEETGAEHFRLCLFSSTLRIIHNSTHCSLQQAIGLANTDRIITTIRIAHEALTKLDLPRRRIAVCGLNPHAGEAGAFGTEEIDEIQPAIEQCRAEGIDCTGPYPADTVFNSMVRGDFDMVVAMYHDQGHGPMKLVAMDEGVNVTLGVPIVRTSVDHGTAYDIAGRGIAREDSLHSAIALAGQLASRV